MGFIRDNETYANENLIERYHDQALTTQMIEDFFMDMFYSKLEEQKKGRETSGFTGALGAWRLIALICSELGIQGPHPMPPPAMYNLGGNEMPGGYTYLKGFPKQEQDLPNG